MDYYATLRSPRWKKLKWRRLMVAGFRCERCGRAYIGRSPKGALRVFDLHHATYQRVSEENLNDVRILCRDCHKTIHGKAVNS